LVKAVFAAARERAPALRLIEIARADAARLGELLPALEGAKERVILFIDDLSFEPGDEGLKALKPVLDGGVGGRPANTILYATSNRRHLVGRDARENTVDDLLWADAAEDKLALADRFGLWLGFHAIDQDLYLAIVRAYAARFSLACVDLDTRALAWSRL